MVFDAIQFNAVVAIRPAFDGDSIPGINTMKSNMYQHRLLEKERATS